MPSCHPALRKCVAFTLAELLITLGIIGIVAALTIANLVTKYQEKANIVRLKKVYSVLSTAVNSAIEENGPLNNLVNPDDPDMTNKRNLAIRKVISEHLKYTKTCSPPSDCYPDLPVKKTDGSKNTAQHPLGRYSSSQEKFYLTDGTVIVIIPLHTYLDNWCAYPVTATKAKPYGSWCAKIVVDLNGELKGPNRDGADIFAFHVYQNILLPVGQKLDHPIENFTVCNGTSNYGFDWGTCTAWALYNENMDYLHCPKELSWESKHSCK